jgi:hypothetical protein
MKRQHFSLQTLAFSLCLLVSAQNGELGDPQFLARLNSVSGPSFPYDDIESYPNGATVNGLAGGVHWIGAYVDRFAPTGIYAFDDFESYAAGAAVGGLTGGGFGWSGAYVDRAGLFGIKSMDDFESYTDGAAVNGLNGGIGWSGAIVDR